MQAEVKINEWALDRARRALGLKRDVLVKFEDLGDDTAAKYCGPDVFHGWHVIRINTRGRIDAMACFLAHELMHARQCERAGSWHRFEAIYRHQLRAAGISPRDRDFYARYREIPFEVEAYRYQYLDPHPDLICPCDWTDPLDKQTE